MTRTRRRVVHAFALASTLMIGAAAAVAQAPGAQDPWPGLAHQIFRDARLLDGKNVIALDMPYRAEDAALVPLTVRNLLPAGDGRELKGLTIVIDGNPSPVAATFTFGPNAGIGTISTRVRVDSYTNVHAIAALSDGKLYMVQTFIKAAGGCSAPAVKDEAEAKAHIGEMRFRQFTAADSASTPHDVEVTIRHPNNSGLQMDQLTHLYIPAFFVDDLKVWQGDDLLFAMEGGISIAQNPSIRFTYRPNGANVVRVEARDTEKHVYKGEWPLTGM